MPHDADACARVPPLRTMQVLRVFGQIFFQVLDVATMSLLLITMDCQYFSVPDGRLGYLKVRRRACCSPHGRGACQGTTQA